MNFIRIRRRAGRRATPPGTGQPPATQHKPHRPHPASWPGRDGFAGQFAPDVLAAATMAAGQNRPAPATANRRRRTTTTARPLPHTIQLCIHCRRNPAGFWVSRNGSQKIRPATGAPK